MEKGKIIEIKPKRIYKKADDFKKYYVTGAIGGFRNPYDFRLTFYNIDSNEFVLRTQALKENKNIDDFELQNKLKEYEMPHILMCELIMTKQAVKELYNFLKKELKILSELKDILCPSCKEPIEWIPTDKDDIFDGKCPKCGMEFIKDKTTIIAKPKVS